MLISEIHCNTFQENMTLFIFFQGEAIECAGICVKSNWIYDCIKKKGLVPTEKYKVT